MEVVETLLNPHTDRVAELAHSIMHLIFAHRRLLPGEGAKETAWSDEVAPHLPKIMRAIQAHQPIRLVLPAFPAKSPSRQKTLSHLPDHGEELAFHNLNALCTRIGRLYAPGARLIVCSDGRVFADIVRIPDADVSAYNSEMRKRASEWGLQYIEFFDLDDVYPSVKDFGMLREELMIVYGESLAALKERCRTDRHAAEMYRGITRFLFEDFCGLDEFQALSRNAIQSLARVAAYRVIQRSNAWGCLLAERLPDAVRLSIHPQLRISEKIGINLISDQDCWATPWHSVVLKRGEQIELVPRRLAEDLNATLVFRQGRPSHFQLHDDVSAH